MIKIGLLGAGYLGKIHLRLLKEIPHFEVIGFYDSNPEIANSVSNEFGVKAFSNPEELIQESEAVDIVTPTFSHFDLATSAIKKGKHTFIEKPLVTTWKETQSLLELTNDIPVKVQVGYVERFNPAFLTALPYITEPLLIEAYRISEYSLRGTDVPVVLDMMIHDLDIIMHIVKSPIERIHAGGVAVVSKTQDIANVRIEFANGCIANITSNRIALRKTRKLKIFQKDSYLNVDFLNKKVEVYNLSEDIVPNNRLAVTIGDGVIGHQKQILIDRPRVPENNAIKQELEGFAKAIIEDTNPPVTIKDGYNSMEVAFKILEQLEKTAHLYQ